MNRLIELRRSLPEKYELIIRTDIEKPKGWRGWFIHLYEQEYIENEGYYKFVKTVTKERCNDSELERVISSIEDWIQLIK